MDKPLKIAKSYSVSFSADAQALATLGRDVFIWDLQSRTKRMRVHPFAHPSELSFSPSGERLAVKSTSGHIVLLSVHDGAVVCDFRNSSELTVFNLIDGVCLASCSVDYGGTGSALAWSHEAALLGSIQDGKAVLYHSHSLEKHLEFTLPYPSDIEFSPDGDCVAIGSWESGIVLPLDGKSPAKRAQRRNLH